jgi:chromosome segregation ATPase
MPLQNILMLYRGSAVSWYNVEGRLITTMEELSSIQEAQLILTQERDTLRSDLKELKIKYYVLKTQCSAMNENLNPITKHRYALQRERDSLVIRVIMLLEHMLSIQGLHLILTKERDTLRSEYEELKIKYWDAYACC